jgi:hypothetical protein
MYILKSGNLIIVAVVALFIPDMLVNSSYAKIDPGSIVGLWLFDEAGGYRVSDSSGNGHDGDKGGSIKWVGGRFGGALEFSGDDSDYVSIPHEDSLSLTNWTITVWISVQQKDWQLIVQKSISGTKNNNNYSLYTKPGGGIDFNFYTEAGTASMLNGAAIAVDGEWHHVATTYDGEVMYLYVDGELDGETATDAEPILHNDPLVIGGDDRGAGVQVKGIVDEVGLFNRALSEEDVRSIMENGLRTATAVSLAAKLATTWGSIKEGHQVSF